MPYRRYGRYLVARHRVHWIFTLRKDDFVSWSISTNCIIDHGNYSNVTDALGRAYPPWRNQPTKAPGNDGGLKIVQMHRKRVSWNIPNLRWLKGGGGQVTSFIGQSDIADLIA